MVQAIEHIRNISSKDYNMIQLDNMRGVLHLEDYSESVNNLIDCLILQIQ